MAVFRVHKTRDFTIMSNYHLKDPNLSLRAIGLLSKMLTLPDDWSYTVRGLASICKEGETALRSAISELMEAGYVQRHRIEDDGRFRYEYDIREVPLGAEPSTERVERFRSEDHNAFDEDWEPEVSAPQETEPEPQEEIDVREVTEAAVEHLNERTGKSFKAKNKKTRSLVRARLHDGYTKDDFIAVIDNKVRDWMRDKRMRKYLRPETLFGTKFEAYLQEGGGGRSDDGWTGGW